MSFALLDTQLSTLLGRPTSSTNTLPTDELRILQHFHAVTSRSMGSEATQKILHRNVLKRAWGHPYLMHMALAVATAHLRRLNVEDSVPRAGKQLSVVEAKHWQRALLLHREELSTANSEYDARYDARVETTFLTVVYSFALEDCLPLNAFSTESDDLLLHALSPLAACNGFRALRIIEGPRGSSSTWLPVLMATANGSEHGAFGSERPGIDGLPAVLVELCGLNAASTSDSDEYHRVLRLLAPVLKLKPSTDNFPKLFSVAGRSWPLSSPCCCGGIIGRCCWCPTGLLRCIRSINGGLRLEPNRHARRLLRIWLKSRTMIGYIVRWSIRPPSDGVVFHGSGRQAELCFYLLEIISTIPYLPCGDISMHA
ncbi:hypothetical protein LTR29_006813 [Friedmanniomyces endolithicus]|nr:hypothetical protein LTR29_006813 [Friedmanniomyces endolithicus]